MSKVTLKGVVTFVVWPVVVPLLLVVVAAFLVIAWPFTPFADFDKAEEE
jgi:hypothetical protein